MALFLFANDASSTLAAPISSGSSSATLASGTGALFPTPSAGQQFAMTFNDAATGLLTEIVYATVKATDTFTITRAQEGTTAQNWLAGDLAANLNTAGTMQAMVQTAGLYPARVVTASGAFVTTTSDSNGGVGLNRTVAPATSSTTLPSGAQAGQSYAYEDLAGNFHDYPVTINYPGGTTGPNGATSQTLNVDGQCGYFRLYPGNIWSFKP
jgi:hypothetical protein